MKLSSMRYAEHLDTKKEWKLDTIRFQDTNLLVGKNASGKTRTLNLINSLGKLLSGKQRNLFMTGSWEAVFETSSGKLKYTLVLSNGQVEREELKSGRKFLLKRGEGGVGRIRYEKKRNELAGFQTPVNQLSALARQDSIQHSFLQPLHDWGRAVYMYEFGSPLGRDKYELGMKVESVEDDPEIDPRNTSQVMPIYKKGKKEFGKKFTNSIISDMKEIGYLLDDIGIGPQESLTLGGQASGDVLGFIVKEHDLEGKTEQINISQGMFRALSVLIQINFALSTGQHSCVLIDDIGEGLDFERSLALIEVLMNKATGSPMQLIMATNDRFIMNMVPLENWTVLDREKSNVRVYDYRNSKQIFERFKFTGLSNFDFFSTDFLHSDHTAL